MAVAIAGSALVSEFDSPSYTAAAGSDRLLVVVLHGEGPTAATWAPQFGAQAFTAVGSDPYDATTNDTKIYIGYIKDADIPGGSNSVSLTTTGLNWGNNLWAGWIYTLTGVDQTSPVNPAIVEETEAAATSWSSANVTSVTDGILIAGGATFTAYAAGDGIDTAGWTENGDENENGGGWSQGYKLITSGASENVTFGWTSTEGGCLAICGFGPAKGKVYVNDATTLDGGEVLQTYPGTANWSDTSISMQDPIDTTGLNPPLYVIVETATGATAYRAISIGIEGSGTLSGYAPTISSTGEIEKTGTGTISSPAADISCTGTVTALTRSVQTNMVNLAGSPQASLTGLTVLVWETAPPTVSEVPDHFLTNQTTDVNGDTNWVLAGSELNNNDPIWVIVMKDGGTPIGTCRKLTVTAA